jgi:APA family basic amino acid/polyamine antiporter
VAEEARRLRRALSLLDVTSIIAGIVVGAGLFVVTGIAAKTAGSYVWISYLIGAIPVVLIGLTTVSLSSFYPVEGGSYVYPSRILHPFAGWLSGWGMWIAILGPVCITAMAFIEYLNKIPGIAPVSVAGGACIVTVIFFFINYFGVKLMARVQNVFFIFLVAGTLIFSFWGLPHISSANLHLGSPAGMGGVMAAASLLIFSYSGITIATDIGEEVADPKILPRAVILAVIIPVVLYVFSSFVCVGLIPWDKFAASSAPFADAAEYAMGPGGLIFIIVVAWAAVLTSTNAEQATAARVAFGLSRDKIIPGMARINKYGIPALALIVGDLIAIFLITTGTIELVAKIVVCAFLFEWITFHLSVLRLPKKFPDMYRETKFWKLDGWKLCIPIIGLGISIYFFILEGPVAIGYFAVWLAIGSIIYFVGLSKNKSEIKSLVKEWPRERYLQ